ncbi:MAG: EF-P lysine aminoacylase EpmA, partial [Chlamydiota bacterium]
MSLESKLSILMDRSQMLWKARRFFSEKNILEVDCPSLTQKPSIDTHIDVMSTWVREGEIGYLHTSPEYAMKRLLSFGMPDIYQLSHVYRKNELGHLHNPEFTLVEWYRKNFTFPSFLEETLEFLRLFLPNFSYEIKSYEETFLHYTQINPFTATTEELLSFAKKLSSAETSWDKDTLLGFILTHYIEPHLGKEKFYVLYHFPPSQAALSQIIEHQGKKVAERFEIYFQGIELANGYHELTKPQEQRKRLLEANEKRKLLGKDALPLDEKFLLALETPLSDMYGVAVG